MSESKSTNKKILIVGSSFSAVPFLFCLRKRGFHISVCGNIKNDPCHKYSDRSYFIDYSDKNRLLELVVNEYFDYIIPTCNDYSYLSCSWVAEKLGYPGFDSYDVSLVLHVKKKFREFTTRNKFSIPNSILMTEDADFREVSFPVIVKPNDSFSGRGVSKVFDRDELEVAIAEARKASRSDSAILEEFVEGSLHSHSAFIENGELYWDGFADEFCNVYPYQVDSSTHPSSLDEAVKSKISIELFKLVKKLNLKDGLLHTQLIVKGENFWIIECMRRCPGDFYGLCLEKSIGLPYLEMYVAKFIGEKYYYDSNNRSMKYIMRHILSTEVPIPTLGFSFHSKVPISVIPLKPSGCLLEPAPYDKQAILFMEYGSEEEALKERLTASDASILNNESIYGE